MIVCNSPKSESIFSRFAPPATMARSSRSARVTEVRLDDLRDGLAAEVEVYERHPGDLQYVKGCSLT